MNELRQYGIGDVFGEDGYPIEWHTLKHLVREKGGYRCARCKHPYRKGDGEWSRCDYLCTHRGPGRVRVIFSDEWHEFDLDADAGQIVMGLQPPVFVEARWRILTVHHLDGNKGNCRWWNLVPLDQRCHLTIQGKVVMDREYDRPHAEWFQPYAAGFYAWKYLGEDLAREEVEARLEELLLLELRQDALFT